MLLFGCSDCKHILGSLTFFSSCFWASLLANFFTCSNTALLAALMEFLVLSPSCFIILAMAFTVSAPGLLWTKHQSLLLFQAPTQLGSTRCTAQILHHAKALFVQPACQHRLPTTSLGSAYRCCRYITECVLANHSLCYCMWGPCSTKRKESDSAGMHTLVLAQESLGLPHEDSASEGNLEWPSQYTAEPA